MKPDYLLYRNAWRFAGPPHLEQRLRPDEYKLLLKQGGYFVRNTYDFDCQEETSFWNLIKDHCGGLEELSSNTKNRVTKALEHLEYRLVEPEYVEKNGYPILSATFCWYSCRTSSYSSISFSNIAAKIRRICENLRF